MKHLGLAGLAWLSGVSCLNFLTKTPASGTVKELPGYPVQNSPSVSFLSLGGGCRQGRNSIWYCVNGMPQKETLDKAAFTCLLVFYQCLSPLFQFSLSAVTLVYLSQWVVGALGHPAHPSTSGSLFWDSCRAPQTIYQRACPLGYNEFHFFQKIKNTDPVMGAKFRSKTHLLNTLDFWRRFLRVWLQSLKKVLVWPKQIFFGKNRKNAEFHADFKSAEKVLKKYTKKKL